MHGIDRMKDVVEEQVLLLHIILHLHGGTVVLEYVCFGSRHLPS